MLLPLPLNDLAYQAYIVPVVQIQRSQRHARLQIAGAQRASLSPLLRHPVFGIAAVLYKSIAFWGGVFGFGFGF